MGDWKELRWKDMVQKITNNSAIHGYSSSHLIVTVWPCKEQCRTKL